MKRYKSWLEYIHRHFYAYTSVIVVACIGMLVLWFTSVQRQTDRSPTEHSSHFTPSHLTDIPVLIKGAGLSTSSHFGKPRLPLHFIENVGQTDPAVHYVAKGARQTLFFTPSAIVFSTTRRQSEKALLASDVKLQFVGAKTVPAIEGFNLLSGEAHFVKTLGAGLSEMSAKMFGSIVYRDIYPGIDLYYVGNEDQLKSEFRVAPGYDAQCIRMYYDGAEDVFIRNDGALVVETKAGELVEGAPFIYQVVDGKSISIDGSYRLSNNDVISFNIGAYNHDVPLIIDPQVTYSSFYGGTNEDDGLYVAVDPAGNAYFVGTTASFDYPVTPGAVQAASGGGPQVVNRGYGEAFVTKINAAGDATVYSTYLGGNQDDVAGGVAVDAAGNAYVAGYSASADFPTTAGSYQTVNPGGPGSGFALKLDPSGALVYSTFLGTTGEDGVGGIAIDVNGRAYVAGATSSAAFPVTPGAIQPAYGGGSAQNNGDGFVAIVNETGTALDYATYLGGNQGDAATRIALDPAGNIHVGGITESPNFPIVNPVPFPGLRGNFDIFVTKLTPTGDAFVHSNVLGGTDVENPLGIAADANGNSIIAGWSDGADYPTTPTSFQPLHGGNRDLVVSKIEANGNNFVFSTYLGTPGWDEGYSSGIGLLSDGSIVIAGHTDDPTFPTTPGAFQAVHGGGFADGTLTVLNSAGDNLVYSTYIGGDGTDGPSSIGTNGNDRVCISGWSNSGDYPTVNPLYGVNNNPLINQWFGGDAFITCFDFGAADADLALTKTDNPDPVLQGNQLTYTLTVNNNGPLDATGVTITDTLPAEVAFNAASAGCTENNGTVTCDIGGLANGAQVAVDIMVVPNTAGSILNTATVTLAENDPDLNDNTVNETTQVTPVADLGITKSDNVDPVPQGGSLTYSITVENDGPSAATDVIVTDTLPADVTFDSASQACTRSNGIVTCGFGNIPVGGQETVTIDVTTGQPGTITNNVTVVSNEVDLNPDNSSAAETTTVTPNADLGVTVVDDPDPVRVNEPLTLEIDLMNSGPANANNVTASVLLSPDVTFLSGPDECRSDVGEVTCNFGVLDANLDVSFNIEVTAPATSEKTATDKTITNTVSVSADEADPDPANNTASTTTQVLEVADLAVTKTDSDDPAGTNATLTYTLGVTNNGPSQATGVTLVDTLPDEVTFVAADNQACTETNSVVTCNIGTLNNGQSATVEIDVTTPATAVTLTNSAGVSGNELDPDNNNNAVSEDTEVVETPVLSRIEVSPSSVDLNVGQTQQFTAAGFDQFDQPFAISPAWTATGGTIDENGLYTAGDASGSFTITATDSGVQGTADVTILSGMAVEDETVPEKFALLQNYPNPFNVATTLSFHVKESVHVRLMVYNLLGHEVGVMADRVYAPGRYQVTFEAEWLPSGVYLYRIEMGDFADEKTMLLLK